MRMKGRILLGFYSLLFIAAGAVILAGVVTWPQLAAELERVFSTAESRWIAGLIGALFILIGLVGFWDSVRSAPVEEGVVQEMNLGRVTTTNAALENVVRRAVRQIRGVREVRPVIRPLPGGVDVFLRLILLPEVKVPEVAAEVQEAVKEQIRATVGVEVTEVRIRVDNITYDPTARVE